MASESSYPPLYRLDDSTYLIDLFFQGEPHTVGSYLLTGDEPTLVETGPTTTVEALLSGVRRAGVDPEALKYVVVTHVHLDHAGAVGVLMRRFPNIELFVHPAGAPHLIDPTRLVKSAGRIYENMMDQLWGEVAPAPGDRVHALSDGETVRLGRRRLTALDTPGHARHHLSLFDEDRRWMFTGDAGGVSVPGTSYVRPPTPPPDIDLGAWHETLDRLSAHRPERLMLTHFGAKDDPVSVLEQLRTRLDYAANVVRRGLDDGLEGDALLAKFHEATRADMEADVPEEARVRFELADNDQMNVQGLVRYWQKRDERTANETSGER